MATDVDWGQIYFGPSSNYALAEHIQQAIVRQTSPEPRSERDSQDVGSLLDVFMQRHLFFGTPVPQPGPVPAAYSCWHESFLSLVPPPVGKKLLENFKTTTLNILPFYTGHDLDMSLQRLYEGEDGESLSSPQSRAVILAILAIGALSEAVTDTAESLFLMAKQQSALFEDVASLTSIHFSLLAADYQLGIGRGTSAYLAIGLACRKALCMGLFARPTESRSREAHLEQVRVTVWALYYYDT